MLLKGVKSAHLGLRSTVLRSSNSLVSRCMATKKPDEFEVEPMLPPDYPDIPIIHYQKRNPWIYDDQQERRNFEEVLHQQDEVNTVWGPDIHDYPAWSALKELTFVAVFIGTCCYTYSFFIPELKATRRSFPFDGLRVELGNDPESSYNKRRVARIADSDE